jgi:DHA2 family multidrug resistance protein
MRNIGGSVGIAITSTILTRQGKTSAPGSASTSVATDPTTQTVFSQLVAGFVAAGSDTVTATNPGPAGDAGAAAARGVDGVVRDAVPTAGLVFLLMIPLVFIMRRPKGAATPVDVH